MTRQIEVEVEGARATFALLDDWAPKATALLWDTLPYTDVLLRHGKQSGDATFFMVEHARFKELPARPETSVTSIYKGYMVINARPETASAEFLISHGLSEYRHGDGRHYVAPVAELVGDGAALFAVLQRTWVEAAKKITVRRKG